ncbi:MAG: nucleotide-binding universal stress UspA family protein [Yoonia sp.]|jgi:nucleotide-binding universal stress UspA family protein
MSERLIEFAEAGAKAQRIKTAAHVVLRVDLHLNLGKDIVTDAKDTGCDLIAMASHVSGVKSTFLLLTLHCQFLRSIRRLFSGLSAMFKILFCYGRH